MFFPENVTIRSRSPENVTIFVGDTINDMKFDVDLEENALGAKLMQCKIEGKNSSNRFYSILAFLRWSV